MMDLVKNLSRYIEETSFPDIPEAVILQSKKEILDVVGCVAAGLRGYEADRIREGLSSLNSNAIHTNTAQDLMLLAVAGRANDFDPVNDDTGDHPSIATVISGIILASIINKKISGKELLTAITLGEDFNLRIRKGTSQRLGDHPWVAGTFGSFATAVTVSKLLGLNAEQIRNAIGLAYTTCSNTVQGLREGTSSYKLHHGWAIRSGFEAPFYAAADIVGVQNVFEGEYGFYNVYHAGDYDRDRVIGDLGKYYHNLSVGFKPYPCCRLMHGAVEGALSIKKDTKVEWDQIEKVVVQVNKSAYVLCGSQPWKTPEDLEALRFNIPYGVTVALEEGFIDLRHFNNEVLKNNRIMEFCSKVQVVQDSELNLEQKQIAPTIVNVHLKSGESFSRITEIPKGHPDKPLSFEELEMKFKNNLEHAGTCDKAKVDEIIESIYKLEELDDVNQVFSLLWK